MAKTEHYYTVFEEGCFYHIYNRTIDKQPMFKTESNYEFFLKQYNKYLSPVTDTYAYCLLGNHFHILLRVKENSSIITDLSSFQKLSNLPVANISNKSTHDLVSHQFRKFFQSYAMAFNKQYGRVGTLFQTPFKRVLVKEDSYFTQLVYYIHSNPQHHNLINDFRKWRWSSYERILLDKPSALKKQEVIEWFGNKQMYEQYHASIQKVMLEEKMLFED
jgi:REP element-mobilizing transposase RayT